MTDMENGFQCLSKQTIHFCLRLTERQLEGDWRWMEDRAELPVTLLTGLKLKLSSLYTVHTHAWTEKYMQTHVLQSIQWASSVMSTLLAHSTKSCNQSLCCVTNNSTNQSNVSSADSYHPSNRFTACKEPADGTVVAVSKVRLKYFNQI